MLICPKEEALVKLFYNVSSPFQLLFLILCFSAIFLVTFLTFTGRYPLIQRDQEYEYVYTEDEEEEEEEEEEETQEGYSCVDSTKRLEITCGKETRVFLHNKGPQRTHSYSEEFISPEESLNEESEEKHYSETFSLHNSPQVSDFENEEAQTVDQDFPARDADSVPNSAQVESRTTSPINLNAYKRNKNRDDDHVSVEIIKNKKVQEANLARDERFFVFASTQLQSKKLMVEEKDDESSTWRSSINGRDSETEDAFSSSSRRSCPKWESYTLFQKYDEEMAILDRISAQKLHETESLRSIQMSPRSMSERIVYKFQTTNKRRADVGHNPYHELEAAYVAQICLTWEALSWNYKNFRSKHASHQDHDTGCSATIAQQFQQFQVLLRRYIENEPYEHGRRPEIYARMRLLAPKLLLVPEYQDLEEDPKDGGFQCKISSASFLKIMEDGIKTFMNFLKNDREKPCQILAAYFRRNQRGTVDPTLLRLMKKKRVKVKDLSHSGKCLRKRMLKVEMDMDVLMALIDLKVVSRVLRMNDLSEEQLHWCEEKMSKVRIMEGKLQRDYSTPLFFPSH
ncbi:structural constituent of ribosome [Spatholobus suberectus]|nr:structural constituent of ribosome [Spatholobus suberectus]